MVIQNLMKRIQCSLSKPFSSWHIPTTESSPIATHALHNDSSSSNEKFGPLLPTLIDREAAKSTIALTKRKKKTRKISGIQKEKKREKQMENRKDLKSILPFLPLVLRSSSLFWPSQVVKALKSLAKGPTHCNVDSGEIFFLAVEDIRNSLGLSSHSLASNAGQGYSLFFDELMTSVESNKWFDEVVPGLASLLLRLPDLLEGHYAKVDEIGNGGVEGFCGVELGLRQLDSQQAGIVFLSQVTDLIASRIRFCQGWMKLY